MTIQEKLNVIVKDIRQKLPRLMQLEEGCWVERDGDIGKIIKSNKESYSLLINNNPNPFSYLKSTTKKEEIIGKEPMLNDVLDYMHKSNIELNYYIDNKEGIMNLIFSDYNLYYDFCKSNANLPEKEFEEKEKEISPKIEASWNLSKLYLKDQSEGLVNFLYSRLNKQNFKDLIEQVKPLMS